MGRRRRDEDERRVIKSPKYTKAEDEAIDDLWRGVSQHWNGWIKTRKHFKREKYVRGHDEDISTDDDTYNVTDVSGDSNVSSEDDEETEEVDADSSSTECFEPECKRIKMSTSPVNDIVESLCAGTSSAPEATVKVETKAEPKEVQTESPVTVTASTQWNTDDFAIVLESDEEDNVTIPATPQQPIYHTPQPLPQVVDEVQVIHQVQAPRQSTYQSPPSNESVNGHRQPRQRRRVVVESSSSDDSSLFAPSTPPRRRPHLPPTSGSDQDSDYSGFRRRCGREGPDSDSSDNVSNSSSSSDDDGNSSDDSSSSVANSDDSSSSSDS